MFECNLPTGSLTSYLQGQAAGGDGAHATPTQLEDALSWRTGFVTFRNTVLSDAVAEFNRYRVRKIVIGDPSIAPLRISGKFRAGNADAFIWLLQQGFPVTVEEQQRRTVLKKRP